MRVTLLDQEYLIENNGGSNTEAIALIRDLITSSSLLYSHLVVDGIEIFDDFEGFLSQFIGTISHIEIKVVTPTQLVGDILTSANQYVNGVIPELRKLSDEYYLGVSENIWEKLEDVVEAIQWFQETSVFIQSYLNEDQKQRLNIALFDFSREIEVLMDAVQQLDTILIGDILQFEILLRFEQISATLPEIMQNEVVDHDSNR